MSHLVVSHPVTKLKGMNERILAKMRLAGILPNNGLSAVVDSPSVVDSSALSPFGRDILPLLHAAWESAAGGETNPRQGALPDR